MNTTEDIHVMRIMDPIHGDTKHTWSPDNKEETDLMRELFDKQRKRGMAAYKVNRKGEKTEVMVAFDPEAAAIIFAPPPQGG